MGIPVKIKFKSVTFDSVTGLPIIEATLKDLHFTLDTNNNGELIAS
jgi:hypothetical protein